MKQITMSQDVFSAPKEIFHTIGFQESIIIDGISYVTKEFIISYCKN